jgi:nucleotide-binding universal stress UspA family protein
MTTSSVTPISTSALESSPQVDGASATVTAALPGALMVASDGTVAALAACKTASTLAKRVSAPVYVYGVLEPMPTVSVELASVPIPPDVETAMKAELYDNIASQVSASTPADHPWPIEIGQGPPPLMIAGRARELCARAIVMGLGRHQLADRLFGTETALQVLRLAEVPVLAVPSDFTAAPRRAVVGVDFSAASGRAARLALALFPDLQALDLVHVAPSVGAGVVATPWESAYGTELAGAWPRFVESLDVPPSVLVRTYTPKGPPADALLAHAADVGADLIVVGSHGRGFIGRMIVGSVATGVLRAARAAVFAVPIVMGASAMAPQGAAAES